MYLCNNPIDCILIVMILRELFFIDTMWVNLYVVLQRKGEKKIKELEGGEGK